MNGTFEHIERKVYKRTFLQQVDVRLEYPVIGKDELTSALVEAAGAFFKKHFQLDSKDRSLIERELFLKDDEQQLALLFSPAASMLSVGYKNYNTFYESVLPHLYPVKEYVLNVLGKTDVRAYLRKVNVFSIENHSEEDQEKRDRLFLQNVFSSDFLNTEYSKSNAVIDGENTELYIRSFQIDDVSLELRTYFLHPDSGVSSIFFDSIVCFDAGASNLDVLLEKSNNILYDVYHWSVSEGIIDIMNSEVEV